MHASEGSLEKQNHRMCVYKERDLFYGIDLYNCGDLGSPKSDGEAGRLETQERAVVEVQRQPAGEQVRAHVADKVWSNLLAGFLLSGAASLLFYQL